MQVNDPEALELAFHQGPTFINAYFQLYTLKLFPSQIVHYIDVEMIFLYPINLADQDSGVNNGLPWPRRSALSECFI